MKKYKIINKKRFYVFIVFAMYVTFMGLSFFGSFGSAQNIFSEMKYKEIYILPGDTVWDIALKYKSNKSDVRDVVAEIKNFNQLESLEIKPGDRIKIPLRKK
nr:LysM peptidoglycan-binding domain-containing protein [Tissierella sp.]